MDQFWPIYSYPRLKLKCLGLLLSVTKSKNGPNHLFICQYQCFKEWVRLFLDFQPPLVNTTNVLFEYWTVDATVNFFSEETIIIWIWPSCIFSQILSLSLWYLCLLISIFEKCPTYRKVVTHLSTPNGGGRPLSGPSLRLPGGPPGPQGPGPLILGPSSIPKP